MGRDRNFAFLGSPGAGKTFGAVALASARARVIWIDPVGTTTLGPGQASVRDVEGARRALAGRRVGHALIYADHLNDAGVADLVEGAAALALAEGPRGRVTLVVDEWAIVARSRRPAHYLTRALRGGRHQGVSVVPITQRPADLHPDVRGLMDYLAIFRCPEAADAAHLNKIDPELAQAARSLPDRHCVILDRSTGRWGVVSDFPTWLSGAAAR